MLSYKFRLDCGSVRIFFWFHKCLKESLVLDASFLYCAVTAVLWYTRLWYMRLWQFYHRGDLRETQRCAILYICVSSCLKLKINHKPWGWKSFYSSWYENGRVWVCMHALLQSKPKESLVYFVHLFKKTAG